MYYKNCPTCGKEQTYSWKISFEKAIKSNSLCRSCNSKIVSHKRPQNQKGYKNINNTKEKNIMYGRSIYDIWIEKYGNEEGRKKIEQHKERSKKNNKSKERSGIPLIETFKSKYGNEKGKEKYNEWLESQKNSGMKGGKNPSYGKPAHKLSGRGIKGYIDGIFFRSLLEMQYIYFRLKNGDKIEGAEKLEFRTTYNDKNGNEKTYHPDFLINSKTIIEVKPSKFLERNKNKIEAGQNKFKDNYIVETEKTFPFLIDRNSAKELLECKRLQFVNSDEKRGLDCIRKLGYIKKEN